MSSQRWHLPRKGPVQSVCVLCGLSAQFIACGPSDIPQADPDPALAQPDLLLVTIDTLRADRVGAYGDPLAKTPHIDKLAEQGVLFRQSHAVTPLTLPSHASLLTGLYPVNHGLRDNAGFRLSEEVTTLAEALQNGGYQTAGFISAYVLDAAWGIAQGFETYHAPFHPSAVSGVGAFGEAELPSSEVTNAAVSWWKKSARAKDPTAAPRFAWVHLYDPHTPWVELPGWTGDPYRGEVHFADKMLGRLLDTVGPETIVAITSDHGESLWEGGEREHGVLLGPAVTRVPLIIRTPDIRTGPTPENKPNPHTQALPPAGVDTDLDLTPVPDAPRAKRVVSTPVSGVDLAPTLAALAGISMTDMDGRSLVPEMEGTASDDSIPVYAETLFPLFHLGWSPLYMAQDAQVRLERGAYDRSIDWTQNIPVDAPPDALSLAIERWQGTETPRPGAIDTETALALESLGYMTHVVPAVENPADPRDRVEVLAQLHAAEALPPLQGIKKLAALVKKEPQMADARISLAMARYLSGDPAGALSETQSVLEQYPDHPTALSNAAVLSQEVGELDQALAYAERMQTLNPMDPRAYRIETLIWVGREKPAKVQDVTRRGLVASPEDPNLHYFHALAQIQAGDSLVGAEHLILAKQHGTKAKDIDMWLGVAHERAGNIQIATKHYQDATRSMPGDLRPWAMAGWMLYKDGNCEQALPFLINVAKRGASRDPKVSEALAGCKP